MKVVATWLVAFCVGVPMWALDVEELAVTSRIAAETLTYDLTLRIAPGEEGKLRVAPLTAALTSAARGDGWHLALDPGRQGYVLEMDARPQTQQVKLSFLVRPTLKEEARAVVFDVPAASKRKVEAQWEGAFTVNLGNVFAKHASNQGTLHTKWGYVRPETSPTVTWRAQRIAVKEAALLVSCEANTIATISPGSLRLDTVFEYAIMQGVLRELSFVVPKGVSVTEVNGSHVWQWKVTTQGDEQLLTVSLGDVRERYKLHVLAESALAPFPLEHYDLPVLQPQGMSRAEGFLAVGTNSAVQVAAREASSLNQIEAGAFPVLGMGKAQRPLPRAKTFFYRYAAIPYTLRVALADIVPVFDVEQQVTIQVEDDDLVILLRADLDVREAPIRRLTMSLPAGFVVANVTGTEVADFAVTREQNPTLEVELASPVIGPAFVEARLEMGRSPLNVDWTLAGTDLRFPQARNQRGYLAIAADQGVLLNPPTVGGAEGALRTANTRSIPMRVPDVQLAWRFRGDDWTLTMKPEEKPASIRVEAFHLVSIGDGVAYGSVVLTYLIKGAPVDELLFEADPAVQPLEFTGTDVSRWAQEGNIYRVKLRRKVLGAYNLSVDYTQRYEDGGSILVGGVSCAGVETQTGFIAVASRQNVELTQQSADEGLIPVSAEEIPSQYRLLINAPVVRSFKYVSVPHKTRQTLTAMNRGLTPTAFIEYVSAGTRLTITDEGEIEAETLVTYTMKNSSAQYLDLLVPNGISVWSVTRLDGKDEKTRLPAVTADGRLKVPLKRSENPNALLNLQIKYGQTLGTVDSAKRVQLALPASLVPASFAEWSLQVPEGWSVRPAKNSHVRLVDAPDDRFAWLTNAIVRGWTRALQRYGFWFALVLALALTGWLVPMRAGSGLLRGPAALLLVCLGIAAGSLVQNVGQPTAARTARLTQSLTAAQQNLAMDVQVLRSWRALTPMKGLLLAGLAVVAGGVLARRDRHQRRAGVALLVAGGVSLLLLIPGAEKLAVHALTWGLCALIAACTMRRLVRPVRGVPPLAALLLAFALSQPADAREVKAPAAPAEQPQAVESVHAEVSVHDEADVTLTMAIKATGLVRVPIADLSAMLLEQPKEPARIVPYRGQHMLQLPAGDHAVTLRYIATRGKNELDLPLPWALRKTVQLTLRYENHRISCPGAVSLTPLPHDTWSRVKAQMQPHARCKFSWKPLEREVREEETVFHTDVTSLARVDNGVVEVAHRLDLRISQGTLGMLQLDMPQDVAVTRVQGKSVTTWQFSPQDRLLTIEMAGGLSGQHALLIHTQLAMQTMPYETVIRPLGVRETARLRGKLGVVPSARVLMTIGQHPRRMNIDDYQREAVGMVPKGTTVAHAFGFSEPGEVVAVSVRSVVPEQRVREGASVSIGDERLVYSGVLNIAVSKAGVFSFVLGLPHGYEIDSLSGPDVSHWDEQAVDGERRATVHLKRQLLGQTNVTLGLSRLVSELQDPFVVPRVRLLDATKHSGQLAVSATRGVRLAITEREGISELDATTMRMKSKPGLAFKLLRPDWRLLLRREVLQPRVNVEFLHIARVTDGLVHHTHHRRYQLHNAGAKTFEISVPESALGVAITGPEIARTENHQDGRWTVELSGKWFDREYPMQVHYETRFDPAQGEISVRPLKAAGVDLERGHVVVRNSERVELSVAHAGSPLQPAEARTLPSKFGAGDLSDASFAFSSPSPVYQLGLTAKRHQAASLLQAEVQKLTLSTVVSREGDSLHRVEMELLAGGKRYLRVGLPKGASVWSLMVDRQSQYLSFEPGGALLVSLPQSTGARVSSAVELTYILPGAWRRNGLIEGPQFDLPLRNVAWHMFLPDGWDYEEFGGTLARNEDINEVRQYSRSTFVQNVDTTNKREQERAVVFQKLGQSLAEQGSPEAARYQYELARNYSQNTADFNEDVRVQLRDMVQRQSLVGLVNRRGGIAQSEQQGAVQRWNAEFTEDEAVRLESSLSKDDSDNLKTITNRVLEVQEAAAEISMQLTVSLPQHGRYHLFQRPLQVEPMAPMLVTFRAKRVTEQSGGTVWVVLLGVTVAVFAWLSCCGELSRRWELRTTARTNRKAAVRQARRQQRARSTVDEVLARVKDKTDPSGPSEQPNAPEEPGEDEPAIELARDEAEEESKEEGDRDA